MVDKNRTTSEKNIGVERLRFGPYSGIYVAQVVDTEDLDRAGRMRVRIPALSGDMTNNDGVITVQWTSPFAGSTPPQTLGENINDPIETQKSYGMWMVPPDIGNNVLVCFGDGNLKHGFVIACLYSHKLTHMVPGMPAGLSYSDPQMSLPVYEKNRRDDHLTHNDATRPLAPDLAEAITKQGLANDLLRGTGTSGSRRESPSQVFGILTPGPKDINNIGHRLGGHQLIMDDSVDSRLIRIRSASGSQILMDDNTGTIYAINKAGSAWFEMDGAGSIRFYGETSMDMRTQGNFNIRADQNINIEAGQNINIRAAGDNVAGAYKGPSTMGEQPSGTGGNIKMEAASDMTQLASLNFQTTAVSGDIDLSAAGSFKATSNGNDGMQLYSGEGPLNMSASEDASINAGNGINFNATGSDLVAKGPKIRLNSGGTTASDATPANTPQQIPVLDHLDAPLVPPEFDKEAISEGNPGATSGGLRSGQQDSISSIVTTMLTKEPWDGHAQYDPTQVSAIQEIAPDPDVVAALPEGTVDLTGKPVDVQTPDGMSTGTGISGVTDALTSTVTAQADQILSGVPEFDNVPDVFNNFKSAASQDLLAMESLTGVMDGMNAAIPLIRNPVSDALGQAVIGLGKVLTEAEAQLKQFALDAKGLTQDLNAVSIQNIQTSVNSALQQTQDITQLSEALAPQGISVIADGNGIIYEDANGNRLVDFSQGVGPISSTLASVGSMNGTWSNVKSAINVPLNENQSLAVAHFADSIGEENFLNSNVLQTLNNGAYHDVPRQMLAWNTGKNPGSNQTVTQGGLTDLRNFQTSLFQTPDEMTVAFNGYAPGEASFTSLGQTLDANRSSFVQQKAAG